MQISSASKNRKPDIQRWHNARSAYQLKHANKKLHKRKVANWHIRKTIEVTMPREIVLDPDNPSFFQCLLQIRQALNTRGSILKIDFSQCKNISVDACLVLIAELERFRDLGNFPIEPIVYQTLRDMGYFKYVGVSHKASRPKPVKEIEILGILSGDRGRPEYLNEVISWLLTGDRKKGVIDSSEQAYMYAALTEAMHNSIAHGYQEDLKHTQDAPWLTGKRWWATGFKNHGNGNAFLAFYDQGVGIPTTLPNKNKWNQAFNLFLNKLGRPPNDAEIIKLATQLNITSTGEDHRGKGLAQIKGLVDKVGEASVFRVVSRHGSYLYVANTLDADSQPKEFLHNLPISLSGTLMLWRLQKFIEVKNA